MSLTQLRKLGSLAFTAVTIVACAAWVMFLRPTSLGGAATYVMVSGTSMEPGFHTGDLVIAHREASYEIGDIIVFTVPEGEPGGGAKVIHRVVGGNATEGYVTQGDNRETPDFWQTKPENIQGKLWFGVPVVGKIFPLLRSPLTFSLVAGYVAFLLAMSFFTSKDDSLAEVPA